MCERGLAREYGGQPTRNYPGCAMRARLSRRNTLRYCTLRGLRGVAAHRIFAGVWLLALSAFACFPVSAQEAGTEGIRLRLSDELGAGTSSKSSTSERDGPSVFETYRPKLVGLALQMTLGAKHDDNVLRASTNERASMIVNAKPGAVLAGRVGRHSFELGYQGDYGRYLEEPDENFDDHEFMLDGELRLTRKLKVALDNGLKFGHDARGDIGSRLAPSAEPDRWRRHHAGGTVTFGRASAPVLRTKAEISGAYQAEGLRYINNGQSARDYDVDRFGLSGRYNVGSKLAVVADANLIYTDYLDPATPLDSRETSFLVGVAWEATAKTTGEIKVGRLFRDFFDAGQSDFSGSDWEAKVEWAPKSYSVVTFRASRSAEESGQGGGTAIVDRTALHWRHGFTSKLTFDGRAQLAQSDFGAGREDDQVDLGAALSYQLNRWATLRGGLDHSFRDSTVAAAEYDNSVLFLEFEAKFDRRLGH